jgi:hypothetical protein
MFGMSQLTGFFSEESLSLIFFTECAANIFRTNPTPVLRALRAAIAY